MFGANLGALADSYARGAQQAQQRQVQMQQLQHEEMQWQQQQQDRARSMDAARAAMSYFGGDTGGGAPGGGAPMGLPGSQPVPQPQMQPGQPSQPMAPPGAPGQPHMQPGGAPGPGGPGMAGPPPAPPGAPPGGGMSPPAFGAPPAQPYRAGQGDPIQQARGVIANIVRTLRAKNPEMDPLTLVGGVERTMELLKGVQPEVKDQINQVLAQARLEFQQQMGGARLDMMRDRLAMTQASQGDSAADRKDRLDIERGQLDVARRRETREERDKPPTAAQMKDKETASQVQGLFGTGADLISEIETRTGMTGVTGSLRRGAETLTGAFGGDQDARVFSDRVHTFAKDAESLIARSAYRSAQDQKDINTLYAVGPGSNPKKLYGDIDGALNRLLSKYKPLLEQNGYGQGGQGGGAPAPGPAAAPGPAPAGGGDGWSVQKVQ